MQPPLIELLMCLLVYCLLCSIGGYRRCGPPPSLCLRDQEPCHREDWPHQLAEAHPVQSYPSGNNALCVCVRARMHVNVHVYVCVCVCVCKSDHETVTPSNSCMF